MPPASDTPADVTSATEDHPGAAPPVTALSELRAELDLARLEVAELQAALQDVATLRLHVTRDAGWVLRRMDLRIRRRLVRRPPQVSPIHEPNGAMEPNGVPTLLSQARHHDAAVFGAVSRPPGPALRSYSSVVRRLRALTARAGRLARRLRRGR